MTARRIADTLSKVEARRIAIKAQGLQKTASREAGSRADIRKLSRKLGVLQIDSVNVLARAHTLPVFSRLGAYELSDLESLSYGGKRRSLFEYWGHAASLLPIDMQPLFRWRMNDAKSGRGTYAALARFGREQRPLISDILAEIETRGPSAVGDFASHENRKGGWWGWSSAKTALEWLFWAGELTTAARGPAFERIYDIPERVFPARILSEPTPHTDDAKRWLVEHSARAMGVATELCLRDYYRLDPVSARQAIAELVEEGTLREVALEGSRKSAYLHMDIRVPRAVDARSLLAPFDPLIWHRGRAEMLFDAHIRIEIYTPKEKRTHGYYVLPFLLGDRIVGRVDLKADRQAKTLQVLSTYSEPGVPPELFATDLAEELRLMASWLDLGNLSVHTAGDAAGDLKGHI